MKFAKKQPLPLRTPSAKTAERFMKMPDKVGQFAIVTQEYATRRKIFQPGDLVRVSFNQRYVTEEGMLQFTSVADTLSTDRPYMGNQYLLYKKVYRFVKSIPENTTIRLMSKEYPIPVNELLTVKSHVKNLITVDYEGQIVTINDADIEGVPSGSHTEGHHYYSPPRSRSTIIRGTTGPRTVWLDEPDVIPWMQSEEAR